MGRYCFCPGCKSGYGSEYRKRKMDGTKMLSLFSTPKQHITAPLKHDVMKSFETYEALKRMSIYTPTIIIGYLMIRINEEYWKIRGLMGMAYKVEPVFSSLVNN